jgi:2-hydroxy-4-carboxymuconate semialdehyde hemiacetal dehydrogenase
MNGIALQDLKFFAAIQDSRKPNSIVAQVLPCYKMQLEMKFELYP